MDIPNQPPRNPVTIEQIQRLLVVLLHAEDCRREARRCILPHCRTFKEVLNHTDTCRAGRSCTVTHCASSKQILFHWRRCTNKECLYCKLLRRAAGPPPKDWHHSITVEQRFHLIDILLEIMCSHTDMVVFGRIVDNKVGCAELVEKSIYETADSLSDYHRMMAATKWEIELDMEKRRRRLQREELYENRREIQEVIEERQRVKREFRRRLRRALDCKQEQERESS